jgi:hypothetical protein
MGVPRKRPHYHRPTLHKLPILLLAVVLAACGPRPAPYQEFQVTAAISTNTARVGDLLQIHIEADHPADVTADLDAGATNAAVVVRDVRQATQKLGEKKRRTTWDADVTSFSLGTHEVAMGSVRFTGPGGSSRDAGVPTTVFTVESILAGDQAPRPMKDLAAWPAPATWRVATAAVLALLAMASLIALAAWLRRKRERPAPARPPVPPHELALAAIQILLAKKWIEQENVEPFYVELSQIVRAYIEARFNLRAPELTTEEFIREASASHHLSLDHQQLIAAFLEQCDLVKFAKHRPAQSDMRAACAAAERLIHETIQAPPEPVSRGQHAPGPGRVSEGGPATP